MAALRAPVALLVLVGALSQDDPDKARESIRAADIRRHQAVLSTDAMKGREAGSKEGHQAALYIVKEARKLRLKPAGVARSYFQPFGGEKRRPGAVGRKNLVARWPGRDRARREEYVVVGAHYDHVGLGYKGSNTQAGGKAGEVHNGADDNASGASVLLDLAQAVTRAKFSRSVVFIWFDAEEQGLAGSKAWTANPTLDLEKCVAMINCDMIGRNETRKIYAGVDRDKEGKARFPKWEAAARDVEKAYGLEFDWKWFQPHIKRSDHWPFMEKGVPAIFFTGGLHADYHTHRDDLEKINFEKEELVGRVLFTLLRKAADTAATFREP